ncbi:hypothetical protein [Streptomyces sp. NPDC000410]|uniref:hypothetical protein n=1 Tax=Streptomyces sp. NPDC000410 TaxID=3154254 RepID=UPI00331ED706
MTVDIPRIPRQLDRRGSASQAATTKDCLPGFHAPAKTFLLLDPIDALHLIEQLSVPPDALIVDVYGSAQRHGPTAAFAGAVELLSSYNVPSTQLWLRVHPASSPWCAAAINLLADHVHGVVLPEVSSVEDVRQVAGTSAGHPLLPLLPVFETFASLSHAMRIAELPEVTRLGCSAAALHAAADPDSPLPLRKTAHWARSVLTRFSVAAGLPAPVNGVSSDPWDSAALMHDAVLARCAGFGGQCVTEPELVMDVRALFRHCVSD